VVQGDTGVARSSYFFTSESVSEGHPDKVCDRISDEVVDLYYKTTIEQGLDVWSLRCAAETLATTNKVVIAGEFRGTDAVTKDLIAHHARLAIKDIGYDQEGFSWRSVDIDVLLHGQSEHIAQGVDASGNKEEGAGDQGIMFGYATNETPELMPAPIQFSHKILKLLADARHSGKEKTLAPDAKSQVTVRYENGKPKEAVSIVLSTQHTDPKQTSDDIRKIVEPYIRKALGEVLPIAKDCKWWINPTGKFVIGGPDGDTGLTGRKLIVDTYGGAAPHGGGAFSGKDPTKVDRSAAYAARYLAKNVVAAGLADRCTIQLSYAIGVPEPLSIYANCDGTEKCDLARLEKRLGEVMDLKPRGIRKHLDLNKPIYARTAAYGHFGREPDKDGGFSWEKTDLVSKLKDLA
jgi:S-adenosylmethionine synthetase